MSRSVRIKDHHAEQRLFEGRAIAAAVIMLIALGSVIARLVWLQVIQYDYFFAAALEMLASESLVQFRGRRVARQAGVDLRLGLRRSCCRGWSR